MLLVGSSYSAIPLLYHLKSYGCVVGVCGNLGDDRAVAHADSYHPLDYSKKEELLEVVKQEKFDYLVPSCNDFSYLACAWVADQLGYPGYDGYETAALLHTKAAFRSFALKKGLPAPKAVFSDEVSKDAVSGLRFPVLVKPIDSFSGRGMTKLYGKNELAQAVNHAIENSRTRQYLVEEHVEGSLHSHSAFFANGKVLADFFVDEYCTVYPYEVNSSCLSIGLSENIRNQVRQVICEALSLLRIRNGLVHTQFITDGDQFWLIEMMRRAPGDLYGKLIELSTGVSYHKHYLSSFIDVPLPAKMEAPQNKFFSRHTLSADRTMDFASFSYTIPSNNVFIVSLKISGETLRPAPYDKLAILFAEFGSRDDLSKYTPMLDQYVHIQTSGSF